MTFHAALTALAALPVASVPHKFALDTVPDTLSRAQLPALVILPLEPRSLGLSRDRSDGFEASAFSSGPRSFSYTVTHLLLAAPSTGTNLRSHLTALVNHIDAYTAALSADALLGGTLLEPARVRVEPGVYTFGLVSYYGCAFRHTWLIQV